MKAIVCTKYGPPEVLQLQEVPTPTPTENEILVKIRTTTVNSADCRVRAFRVPPAFWLMGRIALGWTRPRQSILGRELAGDVEAVGQAVTRFKPGDAVFAFVGGYRFGAHAEYRCLPEDGLALPKPPALSYEQAAAIPFGGGTALLYLKKANVQRGHKVLVYGASGAVGTYAVQLARYFGAAVTGVCSTANLELVQSLGADTVIDYTRQDFWTSGATYDIIFDAVGKTSFWRGQRALKPGGVYIHAVMPMAGLKARWYAMTTGKRLIGGSAADGYSTTDMRESLAVLSDLMAAGDIRAVIDRSYPLEQMAAAHRYVDTGRKKGVVVVHVEGSVELNSTSPSVA